MRAIFTTPLSLASAEIGFGISAFGAGSYHEQTPVSLRHTLKPVLKRGALLAAANWPVALIQSAADSLFKLLIAAPLAGGIFLAALVVGAEPRSLMTLDSRELAATIVAALRSHPLVLASFLLSVGVVAIGGSMFVFLIKGGTVGVLVRSEREAAAVEEPPLHLHAVAGASRFSIEYFIESARALYPRYLKLGVVLIAAYLVSGALYLAGVVASRHGSLLTPTLLTALFVCWITLLNFMYLLVQIVIAADDCGVSAAAARAFAFVRREGRHVWGVFGVILVMVIVATGASLLATAALGLIAVVPFIGLTVLPLEILAWLFRELVFEYIGLASIGAYVRLYRESSPAVARTDLHPAYPALGPAGH
jgi:hypothetical protein